MENNEVDHTIGDWVFRQRLPPGDGPHPLVLLLHGCTGDENVMWIFARQIPENALIVAPRGLFQASRGGYGWEPDSAQDTSAIEDFLPSVEALIEFLSPENFPSADLSQFRVVGFSQGAALAYSLALTQPERVQALAGLAGFMPGNVDRLVKEQPLLGKPVFVAHGSKDEMVPVERARQAVAILNQAGAQVTYCEDEVGHKLSLNCSRALGHFFKGLEQH
jgi:phospholipase/carboxylesterase